MQPDPGPWYPMEVAGAVPPRVAEGHRRVHMQWDRVVDAGVELASSGFVEGELVRISRATRREEGGAQAVMWADVDGPELLEVPWDSLGLITGGARQASAAGDRGPMLLRVLFPQGAGLWWPECFEPAQRSR